LSLVVKPYCICREVLIDIIWKYGISTALMNLFSIWEIIQSYICQNTQGAPPNFCQLSVKTWPYNPLKCI
jgi:hypothetical protein